MAEIIKLVTCECEHIAHMGNKRINTPNGNPGHDYGRRFHPNVICTVQTPFGLFNVCKDCADDCYHDMERK